MVGLTNYTAGAFLEWLAARTAVPAHGGARYLALFTAVGSDDGTGFTEVSGGSYERVLLTETDWGSVSGTSPRTMTNAEPGVSFPTATADWGTVIAFGLYDADTAGNLLTWDYLGSSAWKPFTCSSASPGVLTVPGHGFSNSDQVVVSAEAGGALPTTAGSWSGLKTVASATTDTFTAGVNTTGTGSGFVRKVVAQSVPSGVSVGFGGSSLTLTLA